MTPRAWQYVAGLCWVVVGAFVVAPALGWGWGR